MDNIRIWRMTDYRNIGFILQHGLHCCNCAIQDPNYINIGHKTLITSRGDAELAAPPGGVLNDYIPFYFHYKMPMLYHIYKGRVKDYSGSQEDIIYLISDPETIEKNNLPFLFTDRHAYLAHKQVYNQLSDLDKLQWNTIKDNEWHLTYSALKKEVKQAEFLVHHHVPISAIRGIVVHNDKVATFVRSQILQVSLEMPVVVKPNYYY